MKNKIKFKHTSFFVLGLLLWLFMGFSYGSADYYSYESYFERTASGIDVFAVEPGYIFLNLIAYKAGLNFTGFLAIYTLIAFLLISSSLSRYAKSPNLALFAYLCYPFFLDVTQIRHFMVSAIIIYSVRFLEEFSTKNLLKFCVCIVVAATQQITALIYLLLLLSFLSTTLLKKITVYGAILLALVVHLIPRTGLFQVIMDLRDVEKIYDSGMSGIQLYLYAVFFISLISLCVFLKKKSLEDAIQTDFLLKISLISLLFIPFLLLDFQYTRFFRGVIILIYICITNLLSTYRYIQDRALFKFIFVFLLSAVGLKLFGPSSGYYDYVTYPILSNNHFFEFIF